MFYLHPSLLCCFFTLNIYIKQQHKKNFQRFVWPSHPVFCLRQNFGALLSRVYSCFCQHLSNTTSKSINDAMLWVDKHRPSSLPALSYHDSISKRLESLAEKPESLPHMFFYGPSGSGKRTRITALLGAIFGPSSNRLKLDQRTFTTPTGRTVEIHMVTSPHHVELSPGDAGNNDRFVIQDVLKELAATKNIRSSVANMDKESHQADAAAEIKVVVLNQVDRLTKQAQAALRRTMEKYAATCRLILCCDNPSKLIAPLRSRCLGIRVPAPSIREVSMICW